MMRINQKLQTVAGKIKIPCANSGLLRGKMGSAIFFFHHAQHVDSREYRECANRLLDEITEATLPDTSYALHWWNELWRRKEIDKNGIFPENSLYEFLKQKYSVNTGFD